MVALNAELLSTQLLSQDAEAAKRELKKAVESRTDYSKEKCCVLAYAVETDSNELLGKLVDLLNEYFAEKKEQPLRKVQYLYGDLIAEVAARHASLQTTLQSAADALVSAVDLSADKHVAERVFTAAAYALAKVKARGAEAVNVLVAALAPLVEKAFIAVGKDAPVRGAALTASALQLLTNNAVLIDSAAVEEFAQRYIPAVVEGALANGFDLIKYFQILMHIGTVLGLVQKSLTKEQVELLLPPLENAFSSAAEAYKAAQGNDTPAVSNAFYFAAYALHPVLDAAAATKLEADAVVKTLTSIVGKIEAVAEKDHQTRVSSILVFIFAALVALSADIVDGNNEGLISSIFKQATTLKPLNIHDGRAVAAFLRALEASFATVKTAKDYVRAVFSQRKYYATFQKGTLHFQSSDADMYIRDHDEAVFRYLTKRQNLKEEELKLFTEAEKEADECASRLDKLNPDADAAAASSAAAITNSAAAAATPNVAPKPPTAWGASKASADVAPPVHAPPPTGPTRGGSAPHQGAPYRGGPSSHFSSGGPPSGGRGPKYGAPSSGSGFSKSEKWEHKGDRDRDGFGTARSDSHSSRPGGHYGKGPKPSGSEKSRW